MIHAAGARLLYLPPYSPDFTPIEKAFAQLKAALRKAAQRTVDGLWDTIGVLVDTFTPTECANYFIACATMQTDRRRFSAERRSPRPRIRATPSPGA